MLVRLLVTVEYGGKQYPKDSLLQAEHLGEGVIETKAGFKLGSERYIPHIDMDDLRFAIEHLLK